MIKRLSYVAWTLIAMSTKIVPLRAGNPVLYTQPLVNVTDGGPSSDSSVTTQLIADSFSITLGGAVSQASWFGDEYDCSNPDAQVCSATHSDDVTVRFFANSAELPGADVYSFTGTPTATDTGSVNPFGVELFQFSMSIPVFNASPNVPYFFSVQDVTLRHTMEWANSNLASGCFFATASGGGPWGACGNTENAPRGSQAFTLSGTAGTSAPEPGSLWLVGIGSLLVAGQRGTRLFSKRRTPVTG